MSFPAITPWQPPRDVLVERLQPWRDIDHRELSLERDVAATVKVAELLGAPAPTSDELRATYADLAAVGYAGFCYHDFAGVSLNEVLTAYEKVSRAIAGDPDFKSLYRWFWLDELFDISGPTDGARSRIVLKNPLASDHDDTLFGRLMHCDTEFGAPYDQTQDHLWRSIAREYAGYHPDHEVVIPDARELTILALMDLVDTAYPTVDIPVERRFAFARGYRDIAGGRVFPRDMIGRIWVNYDTSIGWEPDAGMDHPRFAFAIGAQRVVGAPTKEI